MTTTCIANSDVGAPPSTASGSAPIPRDLSLDHYTDRNAMTALLQSQLPGFADGGLRIVALEVHSVRRNTSRERNPCPLTVCYQLNVRETASGRVGEQRLYGQVFRGDGAALAYASHDPRRLCSPAFGEPLVHLPALKLLLWAMPNDPGLPQLPLLLDAHEVATRLPGDAGGSWRVELLRYTPQHRATLRYTRPPSPWRPARTLYAKTFFDRRAAEIHARFRYFWQLSQRCDDAPLVAEPLGCDPDTHTVWQAQAPGMPLQHAVKASGGSGLMAGAARALALLHAAPLTPSSTTTVRSVAHWLVEMRRRQVKIGRADTALGERVARVADAIEAHAAHPATRPLSLIHGDWHPDQCWVHNGRIVLFDFDEFTLGDPMEDLAAFVLKLAPGRDGAAHAHTLIEQYTAAAPDRFDARTLAWHLTVQSLLQTSRAFVYQQPGWATLLEHRMSATEARVRALGEGAAP